MEHREALPEIIRSWRAEADDLFARAPDANRTRATRMKARAVALKQCATTLQEALVRASNPHG